MAGKVKWQAKVSWTLRLALISALRASLGEVDCRSSVSQREVWIARLGQGIIALLTVA